MSPGLRAANDEQLVTSQFKPPQITTEPAVQDAPIEEALNHTNKEEIDARMEAHNRTHCEEMKLKFSPQRS